MQLRNNVLILGSDLSLLLQTMLINFSLCGLAGGSVVLNINLGSGDMLLGFKFRLYHMLEEWCLLCRMMMRINNKRRGDVHGNIQLIRY